MFTKAEFDKIKGLFGEKHYQLKYMADESFFNSKIQDQYQKELEDFTVLEEKMLALLQREMDK